MLKKQSRYKNRRNYRSGQSDVSRLFSFTLLLLAVVVTSLIFTFPSDPSVETNESETLNKTPYQETYVNCPAEYLEFCTRMSKIPTEPVSFYKTENGRIHLNLSDGRTMVARLPEKTHNGYLIRIED